MIDRSTLLDHCASLLNVEAHQDYCPNGLQVAGLKEVKHIVTGVTACHALIEKAIDLGADTLLVHHGYFWSGENPCLVDIKRERIALLLQHNINLIAYHLPLDTAAELGNNAQLAKQLNISIDGSIATGKGPDLILTGRLPEPLAANALNDVITNALGRTPLHIAGSDQPIQRIAWCTGAGQDYLALAADAGVDAFITGEASERTTHIARERGIHFFAAGHHATERFGVQALGEHLVKQFGVQHTFVEIDNPV